MSNFLGIILGVSGDAASSRRLPASQGSRLPRIPKRPDNRSTAKRDAKRDGSSNGISPDSLLNQIKPHFQDPPLQVQVESMGGSGFRIYSTYAADSDPKEVHNRLKDTYKSSAMIGKGAYGAVGKPNDSTVVKNEKSTVQSVNRVHECAIAALSHFTRGVQAVRLPWTYCEYGGLQFSPVVQYTSVASCVTFEGVEGGAFTVTKDDLFEMEWFNGLSLQEFIEKHMRNGTMTEMVKNYNCELIADVSSQILNIVSKKLALFDFKVSQFLVSYNPKTLEITKLCLSDVDMRFTRHIERQPSTSAPCDAFSYPEWKKNARLDLLAIQKGIIACHLQRACDFSNEMTKACIQQLRDLIDTRGPRLTELADETARIRDKSHDSKNPWIFHLDGLALLLFYMQYYQELDKSGRTYNDMVNLLKHERVRNARQQIGRLAPTPRARCAAIDE